MDINDSIEEPSTAVSLYGETSDAMDDFPILKAFQEYVDKEHAKARHRMTILIILFMSILILVAGGLSAVIFSLSSRNQTLNDRLVDYAMQDRRAEAQHQAPQDNAALVAMVESLKTMIQEQQKNAAAPISTFEPTPEQIEFENKLKAQQERIDKTAALLKAQEEAIAAQKAKLREQELEAYRRKHYPEYYQRLEQQEKSNSITKPTNKKINSSTKAKSMKSVAPTKETKRPDILSVIEDIEIGELEDMLDDSEEVEDIESDEDLEDFYSDDDEDEENEIDEAEKAPVDSGDDVKWLIPEE